MTTTERPNVLFDVGQPEAKPRNREPLSPEERLRAAMQWRQFIQERRQRLEKHAQV